MLYILRRVIYPSKIVKSRHSSVSIQTAGWTTRIQFPAGGNDGIFSPPRSNQILGPTNFLSCEYGAFSPELQWPRREAAHLSPSSAEVKNAWSYSSTSPFNFMAWCLIKQRIRLRGVVLRWAWGQLHFYILSHHLPGGTEWSHEKNQSRLLAWPEIERRSKLPPDIFTLKMAGCIIWNGR
jgi:hypothetical protein